jgi:hypothetical protein
MGQLNPQPSPEVETTGLLMDRRNPNYQLRMLVCGPLALIEHQNKLKIKKLKKNSTH